MATLSREQLMPYIQKYFGGQNADKWLYLMNGESGLRDDAVGDGGAAWGLFQDQHIPSGSGIDAQFASAKRLYDADIRNGGTGFGDWGEGRLYQGKKFGALGNNPYTGGGSVTTSPTSSLSRPSSSASPEDDLLTWAEGVIGPKPKLEDYKDQDIGGGVINTARAQFQEDMKSWTQQLGSISTAYRNTRGPEAKGELSDDQKTQNAITNYMKALDLQVNAGQIDASSAAANLSAYIDQQTNIGKQVDQIAHAKDQAIKYGVSNGKTSFTQSDFGTPKALLDLMGLSGDSTAIKYGDTPVTLDPEGDWNRLAADHGVGGNAPMLTPHMEALVRQGLDEWGRPTGGGSAGGTTAGGIGNAVGGVGNALAGAARGIGQAPPLLAGEDPSNIPGYGQNRPAITPGAVARNAQNTFRNLTAGWF